MPFNLDNLPPIVNTMVERQELSNTRNYVPLQAIERIAAVRTAFIQVDQHSAPSVSLMPAILPQDDRRRRACRNDAADHWVMRSAVRA